MKQVNANFAALPENIDDNNLKYNCIVEIIPIVICNAILM